jgi:hypothetical protein
MNKIRKYLQTDAKGLPRIVTIFACHMMAGNRLLYTNLRDFAEFSMIAHAMQCCVAVYGRYAPITVVANGYGTS